VGSAEQAVEGLSSVGVARESIIFLSNEAPVDGGVASTPTATKEKLDRVPTTDGERDGMGRAVGALVGGAVGAGAGMAGGAAIASLMVPGVGPILAIGLRAAAVLGLSGATAGATAGHRTEHALEQGVAKDDVKFYHAALRRGLSLVIAHVDSEDQLTAAERFSSSTAVKVLMHCRGSWRRRRRQFVLSSPWLPGGDFLPFSGKLIPARVSHSRNQSLHGDEHSLHIILPGFITFLSQQPTFSTAISL
jgi:hypothetical protein